MITDDYNRVPKKYASVCLLKTSKTTKPSTIINPFPVLPFITDEEQTFWEDFWLERYDGEYSSYSVHRRVSQAIIPTSERFSDRDRDDNCFVFKGKISQPDSTSVDNKWVTKVFSFVGITHNDLFASFAHRIVCKTSHPEIKWYYYTSGETIGWQVHHRCCNRACIKPSHL